MLGVLAFVLLRDPKVESEEPGMPVLTVETPQKLSASQREEFTLDVTISDLGQALYPAMSMSLRFDPLRLEFLGVEEGNVFIHDSSTPTGENLPQWSYNAQNSNDTGCINLMYLDITGGKYAFGRDLLGDGEHVLLRLKFRLRGSARAGDVLDLIVEDAVFAASDETQSLAMTTATLGVRNGKLVVGE
ncbi:MAG: hypothetical protein IKT58_06635 [Oscillospiraceae bacterium]|nr:hypothetical protein [Oscillospiraceae bacterium]